jgi:DNA-directed RNA polymerase specialized sigma24 family protein
VLREMEGRSYEEISRELDVSESAVVQLLARARQGLQAGASAALPAGLLCGPRAPWAGER